VSRTTVITLSMGRRRHLEKTLPTWLNAGAEHVIVVDYACPEKTADWLERSGDPRVQALRVPRLRQNPSFHKSRAWNYGIDHAGDFDWLLFFDADTFVRDKRFFEVVREHQRFPGSMLIVYPAKGTDDLTGTLLVERRRVVSLGGFDTEMTGWGGEDLDMRLRLYFSGTKVACCSPDLLGAIAHTNATRVRFHKDKYPYRSNQANLQRMAAKFEAGALEHPTAEFLLRNVSRHAPPELGARQAIEE
jgi:hypothetical protein